MTIFNLRIWDKRKFSTKLKPAGYQGLLIIVLRAGKAPKVRIQGQQHDQNNYEFHLQNLYLHINEHKMKHRSSFPQN